MAMFPTRPKNAETKSINEAAVNCDALRQMVENMPINVMVCDLEDFRITYANKATLQAIKQLEQVLDIRADDLVGTCIDVFHKTPAHQRSLLSDPKNLPHRANIEIGGETLDLLVTPVYDNQGNYVFPMVTWSIITEKVKADAENQRLVATLQGIGASQAMIEFEMDGTIITANENFLEAMGYQLSEIEGKHHSMFVDAGEKESSEYRQFWDALRDGTFQTGEFPRIRKDGQEIWIQAAYNPVVDADGKPFKVVKNAVDITAEKVAKLKADAEADRLLQMVDNMPINVMTCDPIEFKLDYINATSRKTLQAIEHLLPCRADALLGQCIDIFHKNPAHQRQILADPKNLPHNAKIKLGDETLALQVSAISGKNGEYLGPMVSWSVVTGQVRLADNFESNVKGMVEQVSAATTELRATAESMASVAEEASSQANNVAAAAEQASSNVETVASAAEQLSASIREISGQVAHSAEIADKASKEAERTDVTIKGLAEAANKIGQVVDLINEIAAQTNLLALNATIEAARAGDAGKGFAVVANEVKSLATETGKATGEIAAQIASIQSVSGEAVQAIQEIDKTIKDMNEIATGVSAAIEEQTAATAEIARNVQQASAGTGEVTNNVSGLSQAASESGQSATQVLESTGELSNQMTTLKDEVDTFLAEVRAL